MKLIVAQFQALGRTGLWIRSALIACLFAGGGSLSAQSPLSYGECLKAEADSLRKEFDYRGAIKLYEEARYVLKAEEKYEEYCEVLNDLVIHYRHDGDTEKTKEMLSVALSEAQFLLPEGHPEIGVSLCNKAELILLDPTPNNLLEVKDLLNKVFTTFDTKGNCKLGARFHGAMAFFLNENENYEEAFNQIQTCQKSFPCINEYHFRYQISLLKANIAYNLKVIDVHEEALRDFREIIREKEKAGLSEIEKAGLAEYYFGLADIERLKGNDLKGIEYVKEVISIQEPLSCVSKAFKAQCLRELSCLEVNAGIFSEESIRKAVELSSQSPTYRSRYVYYSSLLTWSNVLTYLGRFEEALEKLKIAKAVAVDRQFSLSEYHILKSYVHMASGQFEQAYNEAKLAKGERVAGAAPQALGLDFALEEILAFSAQKSGRLDVALSHIQNCICLTFEGFDEKNISANPKPGECAIKHVSDFYISEKAHILRKKWEADKSDIKSLQLAYRTYLISCNFREFQRQGYMDESARIENSILLDQSYSHIILTGFELYKTNGEPSIYSLFQASENSKRISLLELERDLHNNSLIPDSILLKERNIKAELAKRKSKLRLAKGEQNLKKVHELEREVFAMGEDLRLTQDFISEHFPDYHFRVNRLDSLSKNQIADSILKPNEVMIEYQISYGKLFSFVISESSEELVVKPINPDFKRHLKSLNHSLSNYNHVHDSVEANFKEFTEASHSLYNLLLKDVLEEHPEATKLLIIPDGPLAQIPFEVLLPEAPVNEQVDFASLPYLIKDYQIRYGHSAALLHELKYRPFQPEVAGCLALAPSFEGASAAKNGDLRILRDGPGALPGAQREVQLLAESGIPGKFLFGEKATEKEFKELAPKYSILHLALHGQADQDEPLNSNLKFADSASDTTEDNTLYAIELNAIPLRADLAVLSACNSGTGKLSSGEGILSLARSFLASGARAVISTLWSVDDKASEKLMGSFYTHLAEGESSATALHQAKLDFLDQADSRTAHPIYWAGYVAQGDVVPEATKGGSGATWWVLGVIGLLVLGVRVKSYRLYRGDLLRAVIYSRV